MNVSALFVDPKGVYSTINGVDCWGEERDARLYAGPYPVVAHPPCSRWCKYAKLVEARWGHKVGDDGGRFASALKSVRRWGGVLEHPAHSIAWSAFDLVTPKPEGWTEGAEGEWVCQVAQRNYGHPARKLTWLFCVSRHKPDDLVWGYGPAPEAYVGYGHHGKFAPGAKRISKKRASATPKQFAQELLKIAKGVRMNTYWAADDSFDHVKHSSEETAWEAWERAWERATEGGEPGPDKAVVREYRRAQATEQDIEHLARMDWHQQEARIRHAETICTGAIKNSQGVRMKLPTKLSDLLRLSVKDAKACEDDPRYLLNMAYWHEPDPKRNLCFVNTAGAIMAKTLGVPHDELRYPGDFDEDLEKALEAVDEMRRGGIRLTEHDSKRKMAAASKYCRHISYHFNERLCRAPWDIYLEAADYLEREGL